MASVVRAKEQKEHHCKEIKNLMDYDLKMSAQSTAAIQPEKEKPSTTPNTHSKRNENKRQMCLPVISMAVLYLTTIWIFIESLIKHKTIASRLVTTLLFIISFIESKACFIVFVAFSLSTNSALFITTGD
eukprot:306556_1